MILTLRLGKQLNVLTKVSGIFLWRTVKYGLLSPTPVIVHVGCYLIHAGGRGWLHLLTSLRFVVLEFSLVVSVSCNVYFSSNIFLNSPTYISLLSSCARFILYIQY